MGKAIGEVFECSQNLFTGLGGFEIFWAGAVAFFNTLDAQIESTVSTLNCNKNYANPIQLCTSIRNPNVAVLDIVSRQTIYRGLVTPLARCSSSFGASLSIWIIFSYISLRNFGFSLAFDSSSSK